MLETFSIQKKCELKGEEYERQGLKPFYYAKDIEPLVGGKPGAKRYGTVESFDDFLKKYGTQNPKNFYELIKTQNPRRQLFDIDLKKDEMTPEQELWLIDDADIMQQFEDAFNMFYEEHYGGRFEGDDFLGEFYTTTSTNPTKFSLHITTNYYFKDFDAQHAFMNKFEKWLKKKPELQLENIHGSCIVDFAINSRMRCMRILDSSKFGEDRPLKVVDLGYSNPIQKYFATVIDEACEFCLVPESWYKKKSDYKPLPHVEYDGDLSVLVRGIASNYPGIDLIDGNRKTWLHMVFTLKKLGICDALIHEVSSTGGSYDYCSCQSAIDSYDHSKFKLTENDCMSLVMKWADKEEPERLLPPANELVVPNELVVQPTNADIQSLGTDKGFADLYIKYKGTDLVYMNGVLYVYFKGKWRESIDLVKREIQLCIIGLCQQLTNEIYELMKGGNNDELNNKIKEIQKAGQAVSSDSKMNSVLSQVKTNLSARLDSVEFDVKRPNVFCFKNKAFDLTTGEETIIEKTDYITMDCGYDWEEPDDTTIMIIDELFKSIFKDEEMRKTYISILRSGLSGIRQEKFFMANGCGRNGKGVLNELMMACVGKYGYKMNINVLTQAIKSGANPEVSNLDRKRFVVSNEPNDNEFLQAGNIKRLTGDDKIDARGLYQNGSEGTKLCMSLVLEVNKIPQIIGRIDESLMDRFVNIKFSSYFTDNAEQLEVNEHACPVNPMYKTDEFKSKYKFALFKYLMDSPLKKLYVCQSSKDATRKYLLENDELLSWFLDNYEKGVISKDKKARSDFVQVKHLYFDWKQTPLYTDMDKKQKRLQTMKKFLSDIEANLTLRGALIERHDAIISGTRTTVRNSLLGWKRKGLERGGGDDEE